MQNKETKKTVLVRKQKGYLFYAGITIALVGVIVLGGIFLQKSYSYVNYKTATVGSETFKLEVAKTDADRENGLSERDGLPSDGGMLFDFGAYGDWRMWMVQMRFPIDIVWLTQDQKIVHIKHNATPAEYPEVYKSEVPSYDETA
jgi:uncharacterized membrane protein (UPF0127 family)